MGIDIRRLDPTDPAHRPDLERWIGVRDRSQRDDLGELASPFTLEEFLAFAVTESFRKVPFLALRDDQPVGAGSAVLPLRDNLHAAFVVLGVPVAYRRQGVGSALLDAIEGEAVAAGRTSFMAETAWMSGTQDESGEGFARPRGYEPAITSIYNLLDFADVPWDEVRAAVGRPDPAYDIEVAWGMVPDAWLDDLAVLAHRMSTDVPREDLDLADEEWDAARVREDITSFLDGGRDRVEAVARDRSTGRLVGFTVLSVGAATPDFAYQEDTLVMREHRGHGLGLRLKQAATLALHDQRPRVQKVRTWNATSNGPMLDVNEAMGFRAVGYEREWQRRVSG